MEQYSYYFIALSIGFLSIIHCVGMCGGIVGALSLSLPPEVHQNRRRLLPYLLGYNLGRIGSYALAGVLVGLLSNQLFGYISPQFGHEILKWTAAFVLFFIGMHIAGWLPATHRLERLGRPIWKFLEPVGKRLIPVKSPYHAILFGAIWGWIPCGLVYYTLAWAASVADPLGSGIIMLLFGLGTLPTVFTAGLLAAWITRLAQIPNIKRGAGLAMILIAILSPVYTFAPGVHGDHGKQMWGNTKNESISTEHHHP